MDLGGEKVVKVHADVRLELLAQLRGDGSGNDGFQRLLRARLADPLV